MQSINRDADIENKKPQDVTTRAELAGLIVAFEKYVLKK